MSLSTADWHQRYIQQARWTKDLRQKIFSYPWFINSQYVIELGCGTGAVLEEIIPFHKRCLIGLDIDRDPLSFASTSNSSFKLVQGDAFITPFSSSTFDLSFCHYLLLWLENPALVIQEMVRITKPGGWIIAFAEPDYGGRIDYPNELENLAKIQSNSLIQQGANIYIGRILKSLFIQAGMTEVVCGILGAHWSVSNPSDIAIESQVLLSDFNSIDKSSESMSLDRYIYLQQIDQRAWQDQTRILFVPTFYAWGKVNKP